MEGYISDLQGMHSVFNAHPMNSHFIFFLYRNVLLSLQLNAETVQ